ncbi:hypothetical protein J699_02748 [Acinetobacter sp. 1000160]|nr:hypothetical protein J699_02748 [Acinetobacter sp. 1000160]
MGQSCCDRSGCAICVILIKSYSGFEDLKKPPEGGFFCQDILWNNIFDNVY